MKCNTKRKNYRYITNLLISVIALTGKVQTVSTKPNKKLFILVILFH